jgi:hypothetical protein
MMEERLWQASLPGLFGGALEQLGVGRRARENGMFVFQNGSGQLKFQTIVAGDRAPNSMRGSFAVPSGYKLIAIFHTHPFAHGKLRGAQRGPSDDGVSSSHPKEYDDVDTARAYPDAFHYIRALGHFLRPYPYETYYYGARAELP